MSEGTPKKKRLWTSVMDAIAPPVEDETTEAPAATATPNPRPATATPAPVTAPPMPPAVAPQAQQADPGMYRAIMDYVERVGAPLEKFQAQLAALVAVIPDKAALIKAAMASLAPQGITPQMVLTAIAEQRKAVDEQVGVFQQEHGEQIAALDEQTRNVGSRQEEVDRLREQIRKLEEKITAIETQRAEDLRAIEQKRQTVEQAATRFGATVQQILSELGADDTNIQTHCNVGGKGA